MIARRINREEILWLTRGITVAARKLGLIPAEATVAYQRGSTTNGHAPAVMVMTRNGHIPVSFLPSFTCRHTARDVHLALTSTLLALDVLAERESTPPAPDMDAEEYNVVMDALMARLAYAPSYAHKQLALVSESIKNKFGRHAPQR